jgi:hypothetical protein
VSDIIPIRNLVLYKHGVGTVTRRGKATGSEVELAFGPEEIDDALKSLTVRSLDGGQVTGIHYRTPLRSGDQPGLTQLDPSDHSAMFGLLSDLRGISVTVKLEGSKTVQGRVIGLEEHPQGRKNGAMLVVLTGGDTVEQIATDRIVQVRIDDERASSQLIRSLDVAGAAAAHQYVGIALTEADRDVEVTYTIPSPVWRVSYRLVADRSASTCLLQGWAIFDNHFDEDLEDVEVSLVAGQPVSFRYDLTSSVIPQRRLIQEQARAVAGPVEFDAMQADTPAFAPAPEEASGMRSMAHLRSSRAWRAQLASPEDLAGSTLMDAHGEDLAEIFEYRVGSVSVEAGDSAMVPVVQHNDSYRRELLYNGQKHSRHPIVAMRLKNDSGLTLERGPVTILEDGQYRGEAILPFTKVGAELVLAYAVELGITVVEETDESVVMASIELHDSFLHVQQYQIRETTYTLRNDSADEQVVTLERGKWGDLTETPQPDEESAEHLRWRVTCAGRSSARFTVRERWIMRRSETIADESTASLSRYLAEHALDREAREKLAAILRLRQTIESLDARLEALQKEQSKLGARQDRLRANLSIEAAGDDELAIRRRSAEDFRRTQDREDEILAETQRLQAERQAANAELLMELERV